MISKKNQSFYLVCLFAAIILGVAMELAGCTSLEVVTVDKQVQAVMEKHLPANTTVEVMSAYDIKRKYNRNVEGMTHRDSYLEGLFNGSGGDGYKYRIYTVNNPAVLLHEICHVHAWDFHDKDFKYWSTPYSHAISNRHRSGRDCALDDCSLFNFYTINNLT